MAVFGQGHCALFTQITPNSPQPISHIIMRMQSTSRWISYKGYDMTEPRYTMTGLYHVSIYWSVLLETDAHAPEIATPSRVVMVRGGSLIYRHNICHVSITVSTRLSSSAIMHLDGWLDWAHKFLVLVLSFTLTPLPGALTARLFSLFSICPRPAQFP